MIKKFFSLCTALIIALQLFSLTVQAAPVITINVEMADTIGEILRVSGTVTNDEVHENRLVTIIVTPKAVEVDRGNVASFLAFNYAEVGIDGKYETSIGFSHPDDEYDFHVFYEDGEVKKAFNYISPVTLATYIRQIRDNTVAKSQLYESTVAYQNGISIDLTRFDTIKNKEIFEYRLDSSRNLLVGTTDAEIIKNFNDIVLFAENECTFIEGLEAISYSGNYYKYLLDNVRYTKIDFTAYNSLTDAQKDIVTTSFMNKAFANADEVKTFFDAKVVYAKTQQGSTQNGIGGGNSSGNGGSGGGGSNNRYFSSESGIMPEKTNTNFKDLQSVSWAEEAITNLYKAGIVDGVSYDKFDPNGLVTREQFAKLLAVTLGIYDVNATCDFSDAQGGWYTPYIASAKNAGLINGIGGGEFGVGRNITRQDMAVMIYNALKYKGVKLDVVKDDFTDLYAVADYAKDAVKFLSGEGIINGMGNGLFAPTDNATRAQAAVLIYSMKGRIER